MCGRARERYKILFINPKIELKNFSFVSLSCHQVRLLAHLEARLRGRTLARIGLVKIVYPKSREYACQAGIVRLDWYEI